MWCTCDIMRVSPCTWVMWQGTWNGVKVMRLAARMVVILRGAYFQGVLINTCNFLVLCNCVGTVMDCLLGRAWASPILVWLHCARVCVSMLACLDHATHLPKILNECIQIFHEDRYHEACEGQWRATVRVQRRGPGAKTTKVEARVTLVCASTDNGRPLTGGTNII